MNGISLSQFLWSLGRGLLRSTLRPLVGAVFFLVCAAEATSADDDIARYLGTPLLISNWTVLGPWSVESDRSLDEDLISSASKAALTEAMLVGDPHSVLSRSLSGISSRRFPRHGLLDVYTLYPINKQETARRPVLYCIARISADSPNDAYLMAGTDGIARIWLNGKPICGRTDRTASHYKAYTPVRLAKGDNWLVAKIVRPLGSCGLTALLAPTNQSVVSALWEMDCTALAQLVLPVGAVPKLTALDGLETIDSSVQFVRPASGLENNIVPVDISWCGSHGVETCLVGDVDRTVEKIRQDCAGLELDEKTTANLHTLKRRLEILLASKNREPTNREWQRKVIFSLAEMLDIAHAVRCRQDPAKDSTGLHLRAFRSKIDGAENHYRIFIPESYRSGNKPLGLVVMLPTAMSANRPFLESAFVGHQHEAQRLARIYSGEQLGVLWVGFPCQPYGHEREFAHFEEVLEAVAQDYDIDPHRLHLLGTCRAGMTVLMYAERWPDRFASVGLLDPIASRVTNRSNDREEYLRLPAYRRWVDERAPLLHLNRLGRTPLLVVHDGPAAGHGSWVEAKELVAGAKAEGVAATLRQVPSSLYHAEGWRQIARWSAAKSRQLPPPNSKPGEVRTSGTLSQALAEPFLLIRPTGPGNRDADAQGAQKMTEAFQAAWQDVYFARCREISDQAVSPAIERDYNLVLVGNPATNAAWQRWSDAIPLTLSPSVITISGRKFSGEQLSVQAVFQNPRHPNRKIVVIGAADCGSAWPGTFELGLDGWFDFAIWDSRKLASSPVLLSAGRF